MYHSLRAFLDQLAADGDLRRVTECLALEPDVGALADAACVSRGPVILAEHIRSSTGRIVLGVHATEGRIGRALGLAPGTAVREICAELDRRWGTYPVAPVLVAEAPGQEEVWLAAAVNLAALPIHRCNEGDGGPYLTKALVISRSPDTGCDNICICRCQLQGENRLSIFAGLSHGPTMHLRQARARGETRLPVAIALGCDPLLSLAGAAPLPEAWDEFAFAGALRGEPTRLVRARTVDLVVPAEAEIVIEGYLSTDPASFEVEGPFGEYTGHYSSLYRTPTLQVTAITSRRNPILEQVTIGRPPREAEILPRLIWSVGTLRRARELVPELVGVFAASTQATTCVAALRQTRGGQAKQLMSAIWALDATKAKHLFVVDDDIDIFSWDEVMWAFSTRFRGAPDLVAVPHTYAALLDPTGDPRGMVTRYGFDCTKPQLPDRPLDARGVVNPRPEVTAWQQWLQGQRTTAPVAQPGVNGNGHAVSGLAPVSDCPRCGYKTVTSLRVPPGAPVLFRCGRCAFGWRAGEAVRLDGGRLHDLDLATLPWMPPPE